MTLWSADRKRNAGRIDEGVPDLQILPVYQKSAENNSCSEGHSQHESGPRRSGHRSLREIRSPEKIEADGKNAQELQL
jgi:hypothetical protein